METTHPGIATALRNVAQHFKLDLRLAFVALLHLIVCPYTKVEESFNIQAIHDLLYHNVNIQSYDHLEFPGVVPRTFLGPIVVASISAPFIGFGYLLGISKLIGLYFARIVIGYCVLASLQKFTLSAEKHFGKPVTRWLIFITGSQFHFMFYLSRPLPNIFALILVLLCFHYWLEQDHQWFITVSAAVIIIFRGELAILLGLFLLNDLVKLRLPIERAFKVAIPAGLGCLLLTTLVDSLFWRRLLWAEGEVLWFNIVLNKSSEWGTLPFFWYFYSALPRALGASLLFAGIGAYLERRTWEFLGPAVGFVFLYSFLGHKELRFIIYVFPLLTLSAAIACSRLWENRFKSQWHQILAIGAAGHLVLNLLLTSLLLGVSSVNYPGGYALSKLHDIAPRSDRISVHIDVFSAQTGITRFSELNSNWVYNKTENLSDEELLNFDYLLAEGKSKHSPSMKRFGDTHEIAGVVEGFSHVHFGYASFPPLKIRTKPAVYILKNVYTAKELAKRKSKYKRKMERLDKQRKEGEKIEEYVIGGSDFEKKRGFRRVKAQMKDEPRTVDDAVGKTSQQTAQSSLLSNNHRPVPELVNDLTNDIDELPEFQFRAGDEDDNFLSDMFVDSYEIERDENPLSLARGESFDMTHEWIGDESEEKHYV